MNVTVYDFVKAALLRKYGPDYCSRLEMARKEFTSRDEDV
jgi:hypothetical protein